MFSHAMYSIWVRSGVGSRGLPSPEKGILILESDLLGGIEELDEPRPFTPVALIDGEPVATGFGRVDIDLEPGRYLLQIQSGASGAYWPIEVKRGLFTRVTSFVPQRLDEGPVPELVRQWFLLPTRSVPPRMGRAVTAVLAVLGSLAGFAAVGLTLLQFDSGESQSRLIIYLALVGYVLASILGGILFYRIGLLIERVWNRIAEARLRFGLPVAEYRETPCPVGTWRPVDPRDVSPAAGLRVNLAYVQAPHRPEAPLGTIVDEQEVARAAKRARQFGEDYPPEVRPWMSAPRVVIDGEPVPSIWGVNEYRLAPGTHRVTVEVPPPPEVLVGAGTEVELGPDSVLDTEVGASGAVEALARVEMTPGFEGWELRRYSATLTATSLSAVRFDAPAGVAAPAAAGQFGAEADAAVAGGFQADRERDQLEADRGGRLPQFVESFADFAEAHDGGGVAAFGGQAQPGHGGRPEHLPGLGFGGGAPAHHVEDRTEFGGGGRVLLGWPDQGGLGWFDPEAAEHTEILPEPRSVRGSSRAVPKAPEQVRYSVVEAACSSWFWPFSRGHTVASTEPTSSRGPTSEAVRATVKSSSASRLMPPLLCATAA
ncbi:hypothetical protein [Glycomyces salinus]|uniref:hypothetical protein n=1 Tax=Glycomyces salinus TaxID=980294 RepID=UPI0018ED1017|nr:hypothetical protein [Glycomyces salinus]